MMIRMDEDQPLDAARASAIRASRAAPPLTPQQIESAARILASVEQCTAPDSV